MSESVADVVGGMAYPKFTGEVADELRRRGLPHDEATVVDALRALERAGEVTKVGQVWHPVPTPE